MHFSVGFNAREIENLHMREGHMGSRHNAGGQMILSKEPTQHVRTLTHTHTQSDTLTEREGQGTSDSMRLTEVGSYAHA